jgi:hypothetical protein
MRFLKEPKFEADNIFAIRCNQENTLTTWSVGNEEKRCASFPNTFTKKTNTTHYFIFLCIISSIKEGIPPNVNTSSHLFDKFFAYDKTKSSTTCCIFMFCLIVYVRTCPHQEETHTEREREKRNDSFTRSKYFYMFEWLKERWDNFWRNSRP